MICPRCTIGTISDQTHECTLCGFAPAGGVLTETTFLADLDAAVRDEVERYFHPRAVLQHSVRSLVCLAEDRATERPVVLKILPMRAGDGPDAIDFVRHDLTLAATLEHPHIVPVQRFGVSAAACWYSTAYVPSPTLAESVRRSGPLDLSVAVRIVQQLASALDSAHRRDNRGEPTTHHHESRRGEQRASSSSQGSWNRGRGSLHARVAPNRPVLKPKRLFSNCRLRHNGRVSQTGHLISVRRGTVEPRTTR